jgi:hypothetical protein
MPDPEIAHLGRTLRRTGMATDPAGRRVDEARAGKR